VVSRIITALVLLVLLVAALFLASTPVWMVLATGIVGFGGFEWGRIASFPEPLPLIYAVLLAACSLVLGFLTDTHTLQRGLLALAVVFWAMVAPLWLLRHWEVRSPMILAMVGTIVLLPTWVALVMLRNFGPWILLGVMTVVWIADSAAYFVGRKLGRHKLAPTISPGKTWEGVAGAAVVLLLCVLAVSAAIGAVRLDIALLLTLLLFYFSILGDLFESWMKRVGGVKDSGTLLPGHGGILDRIDALTAALPIGATILLVAGGRWCVCRAS
jgi:phosphatidate cytidylyltransferase